MQKPGVVLLASCNIDIASQKEPAQFLIFNPDPWLGIYRIKKWLEDRDLARVLVVDPNIDSDVPGKVADFAASYQVPVIGVSTTRHYIEHDLQNIHSLSKVILDCGQPRPVSISGGYESTLGTELILSLGFVDCVVQGFGEFSLEAFLRHFHCLNNPTADDLRGLQLPRVVWHKDIQLGESLDFEHQPDPNDLYRYTAQPHLQIPWSKYWLRKVELNKEIADNNNADTDNLSEADKTAFIAANNKGIRLATSSHCLGSCGFCSSRRYGQQVLKSFSKPPSILMASAEEVVDMVLDAYEKIRPVQPNGVYFIDDDFVIGGKKGMARFEKFCDLMQELYNSGRLPKSFFLGMQTKVRHFVQTDRWPTFRGGGLNSLNSLRRAGFKVIEFGVESFNDEILGSPFINKHCTAEMNIQVVQNCLKAGLQTTIFYIPFPPTITSETFQDSLSKLIDLLEQGATLGIAPHIRIFSGSVASDKAAEDTWPIKYKKLLNVKGQEVELPDSFYPADPIMNKALKKALNQDFNKLKSTLRRSQKPGYLLLADTALYLGNEHLYQRLLGLIDKE